MQPQITPKKELSIEEALSQLEQISHYLESGDIDLEKSIPKFKRGVELAKEIKKKLKKFENEIQQISN